jgi:Insecticide toxin TcdB middle/N-terminal region
MQCGFLDPDGDGLIEYIRGGDFRPGFNPPVPIMKSERASVCRRDGALPPFNDPREYEVRLISSLVDITGDGIPDHVFRQDGSWMVRVGTGAGFTESKPIGSAIGGFELSLSRERCDGRLAMTVAGLVDFDGDRRPDLVIADRAVGQLDIYRLVGKSGTPGAHDAGLLTLVKNGYGGLTRIAYGSAKRAPTDNPRTWHQVPFAEIVVTNVFPVADTGIGASPEPVSLEPVRYAYGGARLQYHPLLARWFFPGYSRRVVMRGLPDPHSGGIVGTALLHDAIGLISSEMGSLSGADRLALLGRAVPFHGI